MVRQTDEKTQRERRIQLAIKAFRAGKVPSIRQAAIYFDVPRGTLQNRYASRHLDHAVAH